MSGSWPQKVWQYLGLWVSHSWAVASHAPETKAAVLPPSGEIEMDITSPLWSAYGSPS